MIALHVTSVYELPGIEREVLAQQVDVLEDALTELEAADGSVTDSTVSVDYGRCRVEVEVFAVGADLTDASTRALSRIQTAVGLMQYETGLAESRLEPVRDNPVAA